MKKPFPENVLIASWTVWYLAPDTDWQCATATKDSRRLEQIRTSLFEKGYDVVTVRHTAAITNRLLTRKRPRAKM